MSDPTLYNEAIARFTQKYHRLSELSAAEPNAVALATADSNGRPSVRIVLLRDISEHGFVFYTNTQSRKGDHLSANPHAALCFHWTDWNEQVRVEGTAILIEESLSDSYWQKRPRSSQLASAASDQSRLLESREAYIQRIDDLDQALADQPIPRPSHWCGYRIKPTRIEFWEGRESRMHERTLYQQQPDSSWTKELLYP